MTDAAEIIRVVVEQPVTVQIAESSLIGPEGPAGPQGPAGATGATGAQGPQGPAGPTLGVPVYLQQTDPAPGVPYLWFRTDGAGSVVDILVG